MDASTVRKRRTELTILEHCVWTPPGHSGAAFLGERRSLWTLFWGG